MLLKKSAMGRRRATIESRAMTSWIELARSVAVLNQYCSEDPLKILFQQHRPPAAPLRGPGLRIRARSRHHSCGSAAESGAEGLQCAEGDDYNQWNIKRPVNEQLGDPGYLSLASAGREQRRLYRRMGSDYTGNPRDNAIIRNGSVELVPFAIFPLCPGADVGADIRGHSR